MPTTFSLLSSKKHAKQTTPVNNAEEHERRQKIAKSNQFEKLKTPKVSSLSNNVRSLRFMKSKGDDKKNEILKDENEWVNPAFVGSNTNQYRPRVIIEENSPIYFLESSQTENQKEPSNLQKDDTFVGRRKYGQKEEDDETGNQQTNETATSEQKRGRYMDIGVKRRSNSASLPFQPEKKSQRK